MSDIDLCTPDAALPSTQDSENRYAICQRVTKIPGWLDPQIARRSVDILRWQDEQEISGNMMEIGVFCGRYFAILLHAAMRLGNEVLGVDTFEFSKPARVENEMRTALGEAASNHMILRQCNSAELTPEDVTQAIGRPRLISVDGGHAMETVYGDLELAAAILSTGGLIAANDVLNPLSPGVNEAVNRFLMQPRRVVPIAFLGNKLFLAHRARAADYQAALEEIILEGDDQMAEQFALRAQSGRHHVEQPFHGHPVLIS